METPKQINKEAIPFHRSTHTKTRRCLWEPGRMNAMWIGDVEVHAGRILYVQLRQRPTTRRLYQRQHANSRVGLPSQERRRLADWQINGYRLSPELRINISSPRSVRQECPSSSTPHFGSYKPRLSSLTFCQLCPNILGVTDIFCVGISQQFHRMLERCPRSITRRGMQQV
jgi:hypothetical protein